jgi:hypothetical protein
VVRCKLVSETSVYVIIDYLLPEALVAAQASVGKEDRAVVTGARNCESI